MSQVRTRKRGKTFFYIFEAVKKPDGKRILSGKVVYVFIFLSALNQLYQHALDSKGYFFTASKTESVVFLTLRCLRRNFYEI